MIPRWPLSFGSGPHEQLAEVRHLGVRRPDLLSRHDVLVAVEHRPRPERREVASGVRLRESLAPDLIASQDRRQEALLLLGSPLHRDRRSCVEEADEIHPDVGGVRPLELFYVDELFDRRRSPAADTLRPVDTGVTRFEQLALPSGVVDAPGRPVVERRLRRQAREPPLRAKPGDLRGTPPRPLSN